MVLDFKRSEAICLGAERAEPWDGGVICSLLSRTRYYSWAVVAIGCINSLCLSP